MRNYSIPELISIFNNCKNAIELLETKTLLETIINIPFLAMVVYDTRMERLVMKNVI